VIYRLIRLNFSAGVLGISLGSACFLFALYRYASPAGAIRGVMICALIVALGFIRPRPGTRRYTLFEVALPIHPRSIFSASVLSHVTVSWVTFLTILAAILTSPHKAEAGISLFVLDIGSVVMFAVIAIRCVRAEEIRSPRWWGVVVGVAIWAVVNVMDGPARIASVPRSLAISVFAICMLGSVALFYSAWKSLPESFQIAPAEAVAQKPQRRRFWRPSFAWMPAVRRLFTAGPPIFVFLLFVDASLFGVKSAGAQIFAIAVCWFSIWMTILIIKSRDRWLFSLPISRQTMFLPIVAAPLGILTLFTLVVSEQSLRAEIIGLMVVAAIALLPGFFVRIPTLPERSRMWWAYVRISVMLLTIAALIWWGMEAGGGSGAIPIETWLGRILPVRLPLLIATAVAVVGACYWIALKGFCRMEVPPRRLQYQVDQ
jgi:hypothetical protein